MIKEFFSILWELISLLTWVPYDIVIKRLHKLINYQSLSETEHNLFLYANVVIATHWILFVFLVIFI